ncbi:MAG: hypothetical protein WBV85_00850 [Solirubrobacteraceae bacterium]
MSEGQTGASGSSLGEAAQRIRDAAKYLVAAFGAVGAVLVAGLSLTALPSGEHPVLAAIAVFVAVVAIAFAIALVIQVLVPNQMTLSQLAKFVEDHPNDGLASFIGSNEELFGGQGTNLVDFRDQYVKALKTRADAFDEYLKAPEDLAKEAASEIASARTQFMDQAMGQLLEVAVFYQLKSRFSRAFPKIGAAALLVVVCAAAYAWASSKPASPSPPSPAPSVTLVKQTNCGAYYLELDKLADDDRPSSHSPVNLFPLDPQAKACGFKSEAQLKSFVAYLSTR